MSSYILPYYCLYLKKKKSVHHEGKGEKVCDCPEGLLLGGHGERTVT